MPSLSHHQSNEFTKMILMGDPGTGKTGGLTSLVKAGYWLGIVDYDNGLESLKTFVEKECPENLDKVNYVTLRDKFVSTPSGPVIEGSARAFSQGMKLLDRWKFGEEDFDKPSEWGPDKILVIDSLDMMAKAGFNWREQLIAGQGKKYDQRAIYYDAQKMVETMIANLTSEWFQTNVIVITHVHYSEDEAGLRKGYPKSIGQALSTVIGAYFNSMALATTNPGGKRTIQTAPTHMIDLKNPKPFAMLPSYPIGTGLADFFAVLREPPKKQLRLKRM